MPPSDPYLNPMVLGHAADVPAGVHLLGDLGETPMDVFALGVITIELEISDRSQLAGLAWRLRFSRRSTSQ